MPSEVLVEFTGAEGNQLAASRYKPESDHGFPPALLMHGGGQTRHSWKGAAQQLATKGFDAYTVDARGHGASAWLESQNYTFRAYRDDLLALAEQITAEQGRRPILIGASMGGISGMLAQAERTDGPSIFNAIVLVDITPRMASSGVDKIISFMAAKMREGFATVEEAADAVAHYMPNRKRPKSLDGLQKNLRQKNDGRWYWHWDPAFVDGPKNIMLGGEAAQDMLTEAVRKIDVPALLVRGGQSELVTQDAADEFLKLVPHAKYVDVTDAGHMVAGDKNDIFASAVIGFLEEQMDNLRG